MSTDQMAYATDWRNEQMNTPLQANWIAVGAAKAIESNEPVIVVSTAHAIVRLPKDEAVKLAVDIMRNVEFLWPTEEQA